MKGKQFSYFRLIATCDTLLTYACLGVFLYAIYALNHQTKNAVHCDQFSKEKKHYSKG